MKKALPVLLLLACGGSSHPATGLVFARLPSGASARRPLGPIAVQAVDAAGKPAALPGPVTLSLLAPAGAKLGGTATQPSGTFDDLIIDLPGTATLHAQSGALSADSAPVAVSPFVPALSIADVSVAEGQLGFTRAVFALALDGPGDGPAAVHYATAPLTAKEGVDYQAAEGTLQIAAGQTAAAITVQVIGNTIAQPDRTFQLTLGGAQGVTLARAAATGTIRDDDGSPRTSYEFKRDAPRVDYEAVRRSSPNPGAFLLALCSADFRKQGALDLLIAPGSGTQATTPIGFFDRAGATLAYDASWLPNPVPGLVHPRKCLTGDFDEDGRPDVFVAAHGYDQPPFPGEPPLLLLNGPAGFRTGAVPSGTSGFNHGAAAGDIDGDGHLDLFVARSGSPFLLKGDGHGNFTDATARLSRSLAHLNAVYTAELIDIDADGHLDLIVSGHEQDGTPATIYWGDASGTFADDRRTYLPAVPGWGVTIDLAAEDLDRDGLRDVVLNRTGDPTGGGFYQGYRVQVVRQTAPRVFADVSDQWAPALRSDTAQWLVWLQLVDINADGFTDIVVNDAGRNLAWRNDGAGHFLP